MEISPRLHDLRFEIRYATRVLELQARLYGRIGSTVRLLQLVMGAGGVSALLAGRPVLSAIAVGIVALAQAVDFVLSPGERVFEARRMADAYRTLMPKANEATVDAITAELEIVKAKDDIVPIEFVRHQAYNDVATEMGTDTAFNYALAKAHPLRLLI